MKTSRSTFILLAFVIVAFACQPQPSALTDAQKAVIADSARAVVQDVVRGVQNLNAQAVFARFSSDPDARFLENGFLYASYSAFKDSLTGDLPTLDSLSAQIDASDVVVLGAEAAVVTESFHFMARTKAGEDLEGQGVASIVVQLRAGRWQIVHSHESELNVAVEDSTSAQPPEAERSSRKK
jgi:ketosteroid isomerase-like protein